MRPLRRPHTPSRRGVTLVELMVGLAIGLVVIAAACAALAGHLRDARLVVLETRLTQDLHALAAQVGRGMRRAGFLGPHTVDGWDAVSAPSFEALDTGGASQVRYTHADATDDAAADRVHRGIRLRAGVLQMQWHADAGWQPLSDPDTLTVTHFTATPAWRDLELSSPCGGPCLDTPPSCTARQRLREVDLDLVAHATHEPTLTRSLHTRLYLRNDELTHLCPAATP